MTDLSRASAPDDGVARRTILAGAAWSIPVIATATVAPAASASGTLALAFNQASYSGTACSTITGAYVTATTDGTPTTGASITVTLSNGYTFAGGSTSATGVSGTDGRYTLPTISVPAVGGSGTVTSSSAGASNSAALSAASAATVSYGYFDSSVVYHGATNIPANSTLGPGALYLTPDGRLVGSSGSTVRSGIASCGPASGGWFAVTNVSTC